jgi:hypothetical protein
MNQRSLRSNRKSDTIVPTIMSVPAVHMMSQATPSPTEKEKSRILKLTPPIQEKLTPVMELDPGKPDAQFDKLFTLITDLSTNMTTLNQGLKDELKDELRNTGASIRDEMTKLEARIVTAQEEKHADLTSKIVKNQTDQDNKIAQLQAENTEMKKTMSENKDKLIAQSYQTAIIQQQLDALTLQVNTNQQSNIDFEVTVNHDMEEMKEATLTALRLANSVEQHGRRWSIRILGMTAPEEGSETKAEAKAKVVRIIRENFKLDQVRVKDVDCAHRMGRVTAKNKQTMLVRFFARDLVDDIIQRQSNLKGTGLIVYSDQTQMNRKLITTLKARDDVEDVWTAHGNIWARPEKDGQKFKMIIGDNIEEKLSLDPLTDKSTPATPEHSAPNSPNPATAIEEPVTQE